MSKGARTEAAKDNVAFVEAIREFLGLAPLYEPIAPTRTRHAVWVAERRRRMKEAGIARTS